VVSRIEKVSTNYPDAETAIEEDHKQAAVSFTSSASEPLVDDLVIRVKLADDIGCDLYGIGTFSQFGRLTTCSVVTGPTRWWKSTKPARPKR
jgi:hypothetical protein